MAKKLNYEVAFIPKADQLKQSISEVLKSLQDISSFKVGNALTQDMLGAAKAAQQLSTYLKQATDEATGRLDLSKFNASLKSGQMSLKDYATRLSAIGPEGEKAFLNVASAISKAELPLLRSSKLLDGLWTAMKNTMRWQLTSSMLHGFMGGLSTCYGYAQDLNESLNNIRIVTQQSSDQMAEFAKQANNAAKALSSTTTTYTNAALIYYQQGLSDKEVQGRTDTTIKLANVTGQSAKEVSDQMTAIWNNFYDGSKSLEYYADVITKLGAATASSSTEISNGLQKFAAVAGSVGLSYEYATAALATVTATTRESAETVGTAFKTLFARIQGLKLGDTLDDGTDLNKYSEALAKVGINIKDQNGQLKEMDTILDEMGSKWQTLEKDQQLALAQTVAGVRQYNQLVALMDNWDFFKENLNTVAESEGTLGKQAQIYAESWEAARNRVRAAAEDIYDSIINEDFFISFDNGLATVLDRISDVIDALGGMGGILNTTALLVTTVYGDKISQMIKDQIYNISTLTGKELERQRVLKQEAADLLANLSRDPNNLDMLGLSETNIFAQKVALQVQLNKKASELSTIQKEQLENEIEFVGALGKSISQMAKKGAEAKKASDVLAAGIINRNNIKLSLPDSAANIIYAQFKRQWDTAVQKSPIDLSKVLTIENVQDFTLDELLNSFRNVNEEIGRLTSVQTQIQGISGNFQEVTQSVSGLAEEFKRVAGVSLEGLSKEQALQALKDALEDVRNAGQLLEQNFANFNVPVEVLEDFRLKCIEAGMSEQDAALVTRQYAQTYSELEQAIKSAQAGITGWGEIIVGVARNMSTLGMTMRAVQNIGNIFSNDGEKLTQLLTTFTMLIPLVTSMTEAYRKTKAMLAATSTAAGTSQGFFATMATAAGAAAAGATGPTAAFAAALNAVIWPLTLIVMIAGAVVAAFIAIANAIDKKNEAEIADRKASYDKTKEEIQNQQNLIDAYQQALATYEETGEGKTELQSAALKVAEALGYEGIAVANLTGDYKELNEEIDKAVTKMNADALQNSINQKTDVGNAFVDSMRKDVGNVNIFDGKYRADMGTIYQGQSAQNQALQDSEFFQNYGTKTDNYRTIQGDKYYTGTSYSLTAEVATAEELVKMYEQAQEALEAMRAAQLESGESAGEVYNNLSAWVEKSRESYDTYKALLKEIESESFQVALDQVGRGDSVKSLKDYIDYEKKLSQAVKERVDAGQIEASQAEGLVQTYLQSADSLHKYALEYELLNSLSQKYGEQGIEFANDEKMQELINSLSEEEIQMIVDIVPSAGSIDEFKNMLEEQMTEAVGEAIRKSMDTIGSIMGDLNSGMSITDEMQKALMGDSNFMEAVKQDFQDFNTFMIQSRKTQMEYIRDYYTEVSKCAVENLSEQTDLAERELAIERTKYNALLKLQTDNVDLLNRMTRKRVEYSEAQSDEERKAILNDWNAIQKEISQSVGFEVSFDINDLDENSLDALSGKLKDIEDRITDINQQKIEIAISWDDFDDLRGQFDQVAEFARTMMKDATKVGDNYEYPISKVREWMEVYPDLFAEATTTTNGLLSLNQTKVNDYIEGLNAEADANALTKIEQWKLEKKDLELTRDKITAELQAFVNGENGKIDASNLSSEQIANLVQQLTDYQIQCGIDEATAHTNALEAMGLNEEEYSRIVAEVSENNANNMADSVSEGARAGSETLQKYSFSWKNLAHNVLQVAKAIKAALTGEEFTVDFKDIITVSGTSANFSGYTGDMEFHFVDPKETDPIEAFKAQKIPQLEADLSAIDNAIASVDAKIAAAQALQKAPSWQGSGSPDDDKNTSKKTTPGKETSTPATQEELEKHQDEVLDKYRQINEEIEYWKWLIGDIDKRIAAAKTPEEKLSLIAQKMQALTQYADALKEKVEIANGAIDADLLQASTATGQLDANGKVGLGLHIEIDPDSKNITNYSDIVDQINKDYDIAEAEFNKWLTDVYNAAETKEAQEALAETKKQKEEELKAAGTLRDARMNWLDTYEADVKASRDATSELADANADLFELIDKGTREWIDELEDVIERYHEINRLIKEQEDLLDDLQNITDRTYGLNKIKKYGEQIKALNGLIDDYNKKLDEAQGHLDSDKQKAVAAGFKIDDQTGHITNWDSLDKVTGYEDYYNNTYLPFMREWNSWSEENHKYYDPDTGVELGGKAWQEAHEKEKERIEEEKDWKKQEAEAQIAAGEKYESTLDTIQDVNDSIQETMRKIQDARLEQITYTVQLYIDFKDAKKQIRDLIKKLNDATGDALDNSAKDLILDYNNMLDEQGMLPHYQQEYAELLGLIEESKTNEAIDQEALAKSLEALRNNIVESAEALIEWAESIEDVIPNAVDAARKSFDEFLDTLEHGVSVVDSVKELLVLQGLNIKVDKDFQDIMGMYDQQIKNHIVNAQLNKQNMERAKVLLEKSKKELEGLEKGTEAWDVEKKRYDAYLEEYRTSQKAMLAEAIEAQKVAKQKFEDEVDKFVYDIEQKMTNGLGFEELQRQKDLYLSQQEMFLDPIEQIVDLTKLNNKVQKELDKTNNEAAKRRLKALQDEFGQLKKNNQLSEYDIEYANAKLEATLKQIALEEAMDSKSELRLVRNAQGNWNYQYTANADEVKAAEDEYLDAWMNVYEMSQEYRDKISGMMLDLEQELMEKLKEIALDETLTEEEKYDKMQKLSEEYAERYEQLNIERLKAADGMNEAGTELIEHFRESMQKELGLSGDATDSLGDDVDALKEKFNDNLAHILSTTGDFNETFDGQLGEGEGFLRGFGTSFDEMLEGMGISFSDFGQTFDGELGDMAFSTEAFKGYVDELLDGLKGIIGDYGEEVQQINEDTGTSYDDLKEILDDVAEATEEVSEKGSEQVDIMWDQIDALDTAIDYYRDLTDQVLELVDAYKELAAAVTNSQYTVNGLGGINETFNPDEETGPMDYDPNVDYSALMDEGIRNGTLLYGSAEYWDLYNKRTAKIKGEYGGDVSQFGWRTQDDLTKEYSGYYNKDIDYSQLLVDGVKSGSITIGSNQYKELLRQRENKIKGEYGGDISQYGWMNMNELEQYLASLDTGGYTGSFDGKRLAFLHEKELVLNKGDTENILAAVSAIRSIGPTLWESVLSALDSSIAASRSLMADRLSGSGAVISNITNDSGARQATIYAEFPNVHDARDIEEALLNIVNDATQFASQPN